MTQKSDLISQLAIQTYCFRGLKGTDAVIQGLKECEVTHAELSGGDLNPNGDVDCAAVFWGLFYSYFPRCSS